MAGNPLTPLLDRQGVVILDGGLATELEARGADLSDELWSARLLADDPALIQAVGREYLQAGADVVTSASYQASVPGFQRIGLSETEAEALLRRSVELAAEVRDRFWAEPKNRRGRVRPLVVASVGPYGAFLADGSEYRGDYDLEEAGLAEFHRRRLGILAGAGADLLAFETIPSAPEARVLGRLLAELGPRAPTAWLSFSCRDGAHLADGTPLEEIVRELEDRPAIVAVGVNCVAPALVHPLLETLRRTTTKPLAAYPNSGEGWDAEHHAWTPATEETDLARTARGWVAAGARLLGGCCRTRPDDIGALRRALELNRRE